MRQQRASGILLHPTSLAGEFGIGDLGDKAFEFVDFLVRTRQTYWQVLPLGPTGYGDSPYQSFSAFAGNPLMISPDKLVEDGIIKSEQVADKPDFHRDKVDFGSVYEWKSRLLPLAYDGWRNKEDRDLQGKFDAFVQENQSWLDDYSLYRAIKRSQDQKPWCGWDEDLRFRDSDALATFADSHPDDILAEKFYQFLFFKQWNALKEHANANGVLIVGDVPIFVALDSADVWRYQQQFKLRDDGSPEVVAGVPPDYFSKTGQLWGNPIYDWDAMREDGFGWWIARIRQTMKVADIIRIDHFKGFDSAWEVPGGDPTAEHGQWMKAPGKGLFASLTDALGSPLPFWAEDLGAMTPEAYALRDEFALPGMRILQFAFGGDARNEALPHNYVRNAIVYTGTHDNDTIVGWWKAQPEDGSVRAQCLKYLKSDGEEINWDMIRAAWASVADVAIAPLQDLLGLDNDARMNLPATTSGNWQWRFDDGAITPEIEERLLELTEIYGRTGKT